MRRTRLKPVSDKRKKENAKYLKLREDFLEKNPVCQVDYCRAKSKDVHHMMARGKHLCETAFFLAVCRAHHNEIENNKTWARSMGYILYK